MAIKVLPEQVANQIAAGEVVERPAAVVKELTENSIDAGASKIIVDIKNNARSIRVADNGKGMSSEDLDLAFKRHATSKIENIEDLNSLATNGFRGEALASIAAISKVTCVSKRDQDEHANKIYIENDLEQKTITGANTGTSILIDDLFFNTPARLKFLKSNNRERNEIIDLIRALALAHPEIAFELNIEGKLSLKTSGNNDIETTLNEIFVKSLGSTDKKFNKIQYHIGDLEIKGYCSNIDCTRSDKRGIFTILNHRILKCHIIRSATESAYKDLLATGKHPIAVVFVSMPYDEVDVNVHPTKREVKYRDGNKIYTNVGNAVAKALADGFYQQNSTNYQTNLRDHSLSQNDISIQKNHEEIQEEYNKHIQQQSIIEQPKLSNTNASLSTSFKSSNINNNHNTNFDFNDIPTDETYKPELPSSNRKFVSRLGSIDISFFEDTELKSVVSQQGNKTNFEIVAKSEDKSKSVLLRGDFVGENWIKEKYLAFLQNLGEEILEENIEKQENLINKTQNDSTKRSRPTQKPPKQTLEKIWNRDNYTCVYCSKSLLHPETVKEALKVADSSAYRTYINKNNKEVTVNILDEHTATYDHYLPASKFGVLNTDEDNLYASCIPCNKEKSDSLASKTWEINRKDSWKKIDESNPYKLAGIKFISPKEFKKES